MSNLMHTTHSWNNLSSNALLVKRLESQIITERPWEQAHQRS